MAEPAPALADAIKNAESAMHTWGAEAILVSEKNHTFVSVDIDKAEAYARRVMKAQEPIHG